MLTRLSPFVGGCTLWWLWLFLFRVRFGIDSSNRLKKCGMNDKRLIFRNSFATCPCGMNDKGLIFRNSFATCPYRHMLDVNVLKEVIFLETCQDLDGWGQGMITTTHVACYYHYKLNTVNVPVESCKGYSLNY